MEESEQLALLMTIADDQQKLTAEHLAALTKVEKEFNQLPDRIGNSVLKVLKAAVENNREMNKEAIEKALNTAFHGVKEDLDRQANKAINATSKLDQVLQKGNVALIVQTLVCSVIFIVAVFAVTEARAWWYERSIADLQEQVAALEASIINLHKLNKGEFIMHDCKGQACVKVDMSKGKWGKDGEDIFVLAKEP